MIDDEWLIRDQGAIVRQLDWEPRDFAADLIEREGGAQACVRPMTPETDRPGPYAGTGNDSPWGERLSEILERIMGRGHVDDPGGIRPRLATSAYPGGITAHGHAAAEPVLDGPAARLSPKAEFRPRPQSSGAKTR